MQNPFKPGSYIVIEGNIGAGKTSLARMMSVKYNMELILESFAENTFLPQFYKDPERFAFPLEMSFMAERFRQLTLLFGNKKPGQSIISDYYFGKCLLFSKVNLKTDEFRLYREFFDLLESRIPKPDLVILLKKDVDRLQSNIEKRGRAFEKNIARNYLELLNKAYESLLDELALNSILTLTIDTNDLDFVNDPRAYSQLLSFISNQLKGC
jgi:deoxyadenosine/deoxycytidine kinase